MNLGKTFRDFVVYPVKGHAVVHIARIDRYTQYEIMLVADRLCTIGKASFVFAFVKHAAFPVRCGLGDDLFFGRLIRRIIVKRLFAVFLPILVYLLAQLFFIYFGRDGDRLSDFLFYNGVGLNMRSIHKHHFRRQISRYSPLV
jgi:hypothetical protein